MGDILMEGPEILFKENAQDKEIEKDAYTNEEKEDEPKEKEEEKKEEKPKKKKKKKDAKAPADAKDAKSPKANTKKKAKSPVSKTATKEKAPKKAKGDKKPKAATARTSKGGNAGDLKEWMTTNNIYDKPLCDWLVAHGVASSEAIKAMDQDKFDQIVRKFRVERFAKVKGKKKQGVIDKQLVDFEKCWRKEHKKGAKKKGKSGKKKKAKK